MNKNNKLSAIYGDIREYSNFLSSYSHRFSMLVAGDPYRVFQTELATEFVETKKVAMMFDYLIKHHSKEYPSLFKIKGLYTFLLNTSELESILNNASEIWVSLDSELFDAPQRFPKGQIDFLKHKLSEARAEELSNTVIQSFKVGGYRIVRSETLHELDLEEYKKMANSERTFIKTESLYLDTKVNKMLWGQNY